MTKINVFMGIATDSITESHNQFYKKIGFIYSPSSHHQNDDIIGKDISALN